MTIDWVEKPAKEKEWKDFEKPTKDFDIDCANAADYLKQILICKLNERKPTGYEFESGPLCGLPVFVNECTGQCEAFNLETKCFEVIDMSSSELRPVGGDDGSKVFEAEVQDFIQVQATTPVATVQDAIDAVVAAGLPDLFCKETGQSVPATADDICGYKVKSLQCEMTYLTDPADISTQETVGPADAYYVGGLDVLTAMDDYGVIEGDRPIAAAADAVAVWCFYLRRTLSKAEISVLETKEG